MEFLKLGKYSRATSIGRLNHDITIKTEPAFSICKVERFVENYETSLKFNTNPSANNRPATNGINTNKTYNFVI